MNEKEQYIYSFLNSKGASLSFYVPKILNPSTPKSSLYSYYERVLGLIQEVKELLIILDISNIGVNVFFNQLYLLKDIHVIEINDLLNKYNYETVLDDTYSRSIDSIKKQKQLLPEEKLCMDFYIENHKIRNEFVYEFYIQSCLLRCPQVSYDLFETLFVDYAKLRMKKYVLNPKCIIVDDSKLKGRKAYSYHERIYLSKDDVMRLYSLGVYAVIKNMLHELGHVKQYQEIHIERKNDDFTIKQIKEEVLSSYVPGYYDMNYAQISYEMEAEMLAITELLKLFSKMAIRFKNNQNPYVDTLNRMVANVNNDMRKTFDEEVSLHELFDSVIMYHPELLEIYPQLMKEYELTSDDLVVRKDDFGRKD